MTTKNETLKNELVINRVFNAPVELVWRAWTNPEHMMKWWGPKGFTSPACKLDFRVGGKYHFCMTSPEGQNFWTTGECLEIIPHKKIVWTDCFADEKGNKVSATSYGMAEDFPEELVLTILFEDHEGKTKLTIRHTGMPAGEMKEMTNAGWNESLDKLAATLQ
jgi:uncharacterized protein YndB with AHSA1/START domain